jgi:hypothetical protein
MNSLKKAFTTRSYQFEVALKAQDAAEVGRLLDKGYKPEGPNWWRLIWWADAEVFQTYFRHAPKYEGYKWFLKPLSDCLRENNSKRVELLLGLDIVDYNQGYYCDHPLSRIFACDADKEKKLQWMEKIAAGGIDKVLGKEDFLKGAIYHHFPEAVDLAVRCGIDPRSGDEEYLRFAAEQKNEEMCLYLIEKYGADLERADWTAGEDEFETGDPEPVLFLTYLRKKLNPAPVEKPATIETLSQEIKELRALVKELTQKVVEQQIPVARLDKPKFDAKV